MDVVEKFKQLRPTIEAFSQRLQVLLSDIAKTNNIDVHAIEVRAKTVESFAEKLSRPGKTYQNPLEEITDLCGLRVILYYQEDVDRYCEVIRNEFATDKAKSIDKRTELNPDQFGYISVHLICKLSKSRSGLVEWRNYTAITAEIQVRTVLQHAWASISHALKYKNESLVPDQFSRRLTRIAGLLELSDEQFSELRKQREILKEKVTQSINEDDLSVEISSVALEEFLQSSECALRIGESALAVGFVVYGGSDADQIATLCYGLNIHTLSDLDAELSRFVLISDRFFQEFARLRQNELPKSTSTSGGLGHWCAVALAANHADWHDLQFIRDQNYWAQSYLSSVITASKQVM